MVACHIGKDQNRDMCRRAHLLLAGYDVSNEQFRQGVRVPTFEALDFHLQEDSTRQTGRSLGSLLVFFLTSATLVFFSGVLAT